MKSKARNVILMSLGLFLLSTIAFNSNHKVLEYNIDPQNFLVVVIDDGLGYQKAKTLAMRKAAESAKDRGYKYFKVLSEEKVKVITGKKNWPSPYDFPQNLYQEDIIEKGFNRERFYHQESIRPDAEAKDGFRFDIQCSKEGIEAYKVCDYTNC